MTQYRIMKSFSRELDVTLYALQLSTDGGSHWTTMNASMFSADIKHSCQDGRNSDIKMEAWKAFQSGHSTYL